ncbi:MAG: hypothetical protein GWP04_12725 [Gammaproteobacteria bacterium]|nr:hypothetical protein [Gammaproteobacteria bacterium]
MKDNAMAELERRTDDLPEHIDEFEVLPGVADVIEVYEAAMDQYSRAAYYYDPVVRFSSTDTKPLAPR